VLLLIAEQSQRQVPDIHSIPVDVIYVRKKIIKPVHKKIFTKLQCNITRSYSFRRWTIAHYKMFVIQTGNNSCRRQKWHAATSSVAELADKVSALPQPSCPLRQAALHWAMASLLALRCTPPAVVERVMLSLGTDRPSACVAAPTSRIFHCRADQDNVDIRTEHRHRRMH